MIVRLGMGWRALQAWLAATARLDQDNEPDPDRWTDASRRNFEALDALRRKRRGREPLN